MMIKRFERLAVACGLGLVLACGGESSDGDGDAAGANDGQSGSGAGMAAAIDTGLPAQTPLEDVTPEQYANACESLRQSVRDRLGPDRAVRGVCELYEGALTDDPAQC